MHLPMCAYGWLWQVAHQQQLDNANNNGKCTAEEVEEEKATIKKLQKWAKKNCKNNFSSRRYAYEARKLIGHQHLRVRHKRERGKIAIASVQRRAHRGRQGWHEQM